MMPNDLDRELRDTLSTIVEEHAVSDVADPVAAIEQRVGRRHRNRLLLVGSGIAAMIVFVVVVAAAISARDDGNKPRVVVSPSTTIPEPLLTNPVETMPKPPLAVRGDAAVVWTGRDLVVWGGDVEAFNMGLPGKDRSYADGAVFDPRTRGWRAINPKTPLPNTFDTPVGVATEDGVVFARGKHMARWIADNDVWIPYPDAAAPIQDLARSGDLLMSYSANAVFDLDAARWSSLPTPPLALERAATVSTGSELIVVGGPGTPFTDAAGLALDPAAKQWRKLAPFPRGMHAEALAADWDGRRVVVANYDMKAATYDPRADRWTTLPEVPARFSEWYPTARSTGGRTAVFMAAAMVVLDGNRWTPLPAPTASLGTVATTRPGFGSQADNGVLFVFGFQDDENVLTAIDLDAMTEKPEAIRVGFTTVRLTDPMTFTGARYTESNRGLSETVTAEFDTPICEVSSSYGLGRDSRANTPVQYVGRTWYADSTYSFMQTELTDTDVFTISCGSKNAASTIAMNSDFSQP